MFEKFEKKEKKPGRLIPSSRRSFLGTEILPGNGTGLQERCVLRGGGAGVISPPNPRSRPLPAGEG